MFPVDLYVKVRRVVMVENKSERAVARYFGIHRNTVRKMCQFAAPPGYRRAPAPVSPTLAPFVAIIDAILEADKQVHVKQRHTAVRIRERLHDEHGYRGGYTLVREYVNGVASRQKEVFMPLAHRPATPRSISAKPTDTSVARMYVSTISAWTCRIRMRVSSRCIRPKTRKLFWAAVLLPSHFSVACPNRFCTTTPGLQWPRYWAMANADGLRPLPSCRAITCLTTNSDVPPRMTTRVKWKDWWVTAGVTSWCRCRWQTTSIH